MWLSEGGEKSPKNVCWNGGVKAAVERKEATWNKDAKDKIYRDLQRREEKGKMLYISELKGGM